MSVEIFIFYGVLALLAAIGVPSILFGLWLQWTMPSEHELWYLANPAPGYRWSLADRCWKPDPAPMGGPDVLGVAQAMRLPLAVARDIERRVAEMRADDAAAGL